MRNDLVNQAKQRAIQYWHIDGLTEIGLGAVCLLLGLYFFAQITSREGTLLHTLLESGLVIVLIGSWFLARRLVESGKRRWTYPRTGFVTYPPAKSKNRWIGAALAMAMGALVAALMVSAPASLAWMPAITGLIFSIVLLFLALRVGLLRFYLLSAMSLALGGGLSFGGIGDIAGLAVFYTLIGLALAASGGLTLRSYLRHTQPAAEIP